MILIRFLKMNSSFEKVSGVIGWRLLSSPPRDECFSALSWFIVEKEMENESEGRGRHAAYIHWSYYASLHKKRGRDSN